MREELFKNFLIKNQPNLDVEMQHGLNCGISEGTVFNILSTFSDNQSPGTDGLTAQEFYVFFW